MVVWILLIMLLAVVFVPMSTRTKQVIALVGLILVVLLQIGLFPPGPVVIG